MPIEQVHDIWENIKDMGVIVGKAGLHGNVSTAIFSFVFLSSQQNVKIFFKIKKQNIFFTYKGIRLVCF